MTHDRNAVKAGIFIVISVVLIVAVIAGIKGLTRLIEPHQTRRAVFRLKDDVGGIKVGDELRVGGVKVGTVRDVDLQNTHGGVDPMITLTFTLPRRIELRDGARITVQQTLTGTSWLNIDELGKGPPLKEDVALIGTPSATTNLMNSLSTAGPDLAAVLHDVRTQTLPKVNTAVDNGSALLATARAKFDPIVDRYFKVADSATGAFAQVKDILGDGKSDIRGTLANLNSATGTIKEKLPPVMEKLDNALAKVQTSLDSTNAALADLKVTMANARSIVTTNRGKIDNMIASLKTTGDNLKFATAEVRRSPWRLLYKPNEGEMANLNVYDAARQFAEGAGDLNDAAVALRDAMKDPKSDPQQIQKLVEKLDHSFNGFQKVENDLWKQVQP